MSESLPPPDKRDEVLGGLLEIRNLRIDPVYGIAVREAFEESIAAAIEYLETTPPAALEHDFLPYRQGAFGDKVCRVCGKGIDEHAFTPSHVEPNLDAEAVSWALGKLEAFGLQTKAESALMMDRLKLMLLDSAPFTTPQKTGETQSRVVWVIEKGSPAQYFAGFDYGAGKWTPDFDKALHAVDREQAQSLWDCDRSVFAIYNDNCRIADHMICGGPAFTPSAIGRSEIIEECARACEEQGRKSPSIDGQSFYIAAGQCASAIRRLNAKCHQCSGYRTTNCGAQDCKLPNNSSDGGAKS